MSEGLSDEDLARFLRESAEGTGPVAPREPSARARMVTARLREQEARGETPQAWRAGPDLDRHRAAAARRRRRRAVVGGLLVAGLTVLAMNPSLLPGHPWGDGGGQASSAGTPAPETAAPTTAPGPAPGSPTLEDPFAGSPAASWQEGGRSIVMPEARAAGVLTERQVEQALASTRTLLVDANVDPATLRGEEPAEALGVLDPLQPGTREPLRTSLRAPSRENDPLTLFSRFDPEEVRVVGDQVRARGRTTLENGQDGGVAITADYTFVYPLTRVEQGSTEVTRAVVRRVLRLKVPDPARYRTTPGKIMIESYASEWSNVGCGVVDGWAHPEFDGDRRGTRNPTGPTVDPYDRSGEISGDGQCGKLTRI